MNRCLNERALVRIYFKERTADDHAHLQLCADCAEAYDRLEEDLQAIHTVLADAPPQTGSAQVASRRWLWVPAAALAALAIIAVAVGVAWLRQPPLVQIAAMSPNMSEFATDVSSALFAGTVSDDIADIGTDAPYLHAALEAGRPCTGDAFLNGECSDQVSALLIDTD